MENRRRAALPADQQVPLSVWHRGLTPSMWPGFCRWDSRLEAEMHGRRDATGAQAEAPGPGVGRRGGWWQVLTPSRNVQRPRCRDRVPVPPLRSEDPRPVAYVLNVFAEKPLRSAPAAAGSTRSPGFLLLKPSDWQTRPLRTQPRRHCDYSLHRLAWIVQKVPEVRNRCVLLFY